MKLILKNKQVRPDREIYKVDPKHLKRVIKECYCKNVSIENNTELYKEISDLIGLYSYTKNKVNIQPYVIIGKDI